MIYSVLFWIQRYHSHVPNWPPSKRHGWTNWICLCTDSCPQKRFQSQRLAPNELQTATEDVTSYIVMNWWWEWNQYFDKWAHAVNFEPHEDYVQVNTWEVMEDLCMDVWWCMVSEYQSYAASWGTSQSFAIYLVVQNAAVCCQVYVCVCLFGRGDMNVSIYLLICLCACHVL